MWLNMVIGIVANKCWGNLWREAIRMEILLSRRQEGGGDFNLVFLKSQFVECVIRAVSELFEI